MCGHRSRALRSRGASKGASTIQGRLKGLLAAGVLSAAVAWADGEPGLDGGSVIELDAGVTAAAETQRFDLVPLPALGYDSQQGLIFGANIGLYWRAPGFAPYQYALSALVLFTTFGGQDHRLQFTAPDFLGSKYRPSILFGFSRELVRNFYGIGNTVTLIADDDRRIANQYYAYQFTSWYGALDVERKLSGYWKVGARYQLRTLDTRLYAGSLLEAMRPDAARFLINSELQADVVYDSRDQEASPTKGIFAQLSMRASHAALGSQINYLGGLAEIRAFYSPFNIGPRLVLATRLLFDVIGGDVPVALLPTFSGRTHYLDGLGGANSVRGLLRFQYVGKMKALGNLEVRSRLIRFNLFARPFDIWAVAFVDVGRAWAELKHEGKVDLHPSFGGGIRLAYVDDFVFRVDYGFGEGHQALAVVIEQLF